MLDAPQAQECSRAPTCITLQSDERFVCRKGLLTAAFRQRSIDQDRQVKLNQLLLATNAVLAELETRAPIMDTQTGEMVYRGTEEEVHPCGFTVLVGP